MRIWGKLGVVDGTKQSVKGQCNKNAPEKTLNNRLKLLGHGVQLLSLLVVSSLMSCSGRDEIRGSSSPLLLRA